VIDLFDFVQIVNSIVDPQRMNIDLRKLSWIGSIAEDLSVCYAWATTGIKTIEDLRNRPQVHMGLTAAGGAQDIRLKVLHGLLHVNVRRVAGSPGTPSQFIAIERGELDAGCGGWSSLPPHWRAEGSIYTLVRLVATQAANMPTGIPYAGDLVSQ